MKSEDTRNRAKENVKLTREDECHVIRNLDQRRHVDEQILLVPRIAAFLTAKSNRPQKASITTPESFRWVRASKEDIR